MARPTTAFALVRPPGHHAMPNHAMGFCFFNNIAIAASYLTRVKGLERVMILDWDVHHGNGTQDIFYSSPQVLYCSLHQFPHYPGTGSVARDRNQMRAAAITVNLPLPATFGDPEYMSAFDRVVMPIATPVQARLHPGLGRLRLPLSRPVGRYAGY